MRSKTILTSVVIVILFVGAVSDAMADPQAEQAAVGVAGKWLNLVDRGRYVDSWQQAATYFQAAVNKDQWANSLQAIRQSLGNVVSRKLSKKQYTQTLPGAPDGHYVVLEFHTVFENKKNAVETVTPMMDKDGQWRVSGYYIR